MSFITHRQSKTQLYHTWNSMKQRCFNPNSTGYRFWGGKGIVVCKEWLKFENFWEWAKINSYKEGLCIDRINNHGNYEPSNCRWVTKEQSDTHKLVGKSGQRNIYVRGKERFQVMIGSPAKHVGCYKTIPEAIIARDNSLRGIEYA